MKQWIGRSGFSPSASQRGSSSRVSTASPDARAPESSNEPSRTSVTVVLTVSSGMTFSRGTRKVGNRTAMTIKAAPMMIIR